MISFRLEVDALWDDIVARPGRVDTGAETYLLPMFPIVPFPFPARKLPVLEIHRVGELKFIERDRLTLLCGSESAKLLGESSSEDTGVLNSASLTGKASFQEVMVFALDSIIVPGFSSVGAGTFPSGKRILFEVEQGPSGVLSKDFPDGLSLVNLVTRDSKYGRQYVFRAVVG